MELAETTVRRWDGSGIAWINQVRERRSCGGF
jgi:hypothetical protein